MGNEPTFFNIWDRATAKDKAEFAAGLCKRYPSLICQILKTQASCPASTMREWLFNNTDASKDG